VKPGQQPFGTELHMYREMGAPRIGVVKGTGPGISTESQSLLRVRLQAVLAILTLVLTLFLLRELVLDSLAWGTLTDPKHGHRLITVLVVAAAAAVLWTSRQFSTAQLRAVEIGAFILIISVVAAGQYDSLLQQVNRGAGSMAVLVVLRTTMFINFLIMVIYGLLIPNDWRGAARIVVPLALTPMLVSLTFLAIHPEAWSTFNELLTFEQASVTWIMILLAATTVIYGSHVINTLRHEAFEARQFGQYQLREKIGDGGMGEVWRAEHQMLVRPAAIKLIRPDKLSSDRELSATALARFEREAQATARLESPQTIEIYDFGITNDGTFYYVMELLDGLDLETLVETFGPLPPERVVFLLQQACDSLAEAHHNGLVHRDIKPANIYACRRGLACDVVKVLDFGLVKEHAKEEDTRLTAAGIVTGTPAYFAPELAGDSGQADARSDIYSLGCVAYWLLTADLVFEGETPLATILEHVRTAPVQPSKRVETNIPASLEAVVMSCLEKNPGDRPQTAQDLRAKLSSAQLGANWDEDRARKWWAAHRPKT